ncbi:unnamed protein product [Lepidochelys olivacea]
MPSAGVAVNWDEGFNPHAVKGVGHRVIEGRHANKCQRDDRGNTNLPDAPDHHSSLLINSTTPNAINRSPIPNADVRFLKELPLTHLRPNNNFEVELR